MNELERLLARLPGVILDTFRDESFTRNFRAGNQELFLDTHWVDLDDLKSWLHTKHLSSYLLEDESPESIGVLPFLAQTLHDLDISSFSQDTTVYNLPIDSFRTGSSTPSSGYSYSEFGDMYPSEFSYATSSAPSSEFDWYAHSHTSHSSPASEFAMLEEIAPPAVYSATPTDWDPDLASMLSAFKVAPPDPLENPLQNPLDDYFALLDSSLPISDPELSSGNSPSLPTVEQSHPDALPLMTPDEMDSAGEEWPWVPSGTVWLDDDVSSDVYIPAEPFRVTQNCRVERIERVYGIPSQMPISRVATAYIINFSSARDTHKDAHGNMMNLELILKDGDCHSWDGTPGESQTGRVPSVNVKRFASLGVFEKVLCRRARQNCQGLYACDCIESSLLDVERYELDPHAGDAINSAQIQQRLTQGTVIRDKAICFVNAVKKMKCTSKDSAAKPCDGYQVLKKATKALLGGRFHYFTCSNRSQAWSTHTGTYISADVDEDLCVRFFRGESMDSASADKAERTSTCSRIIGSGSGKKGKQLCPFPHLKDGKVHIAQMVKRACKAMTTIYVPLDEDTIPIAIVVPKHEVPHTHPPPPPTKVPADVKHLYEEAVRAFGVSTATVNKVERAATTIQIMGKAPGLVHPSLLQVSTKQGIITALKRREPGGDKSGWEGLFDLYKADQQKDPKEPYIYSFDFLPGRSPASVVITTFETTLLECVELVRSIDQDTTFKRLKAGLLNEYELTAFFTPLDRLFTFGRLYMDAKDSDAFEFAWDKIHEAFFAAAGKALAFKAWSKDGWLVTMGGDMESALWIGMARSFIKRMAPENRPTVDEFLAKVLRVCRRHALEGLRKGIKPHVDDDQWPRFQGFLDLTTKEDVQIFSDWVFSLQIPKVTAWWNHKLNHKWILPGLLECLSGLSHEDWLTTPFTSSGNETQHHWTNSQTGIGLNAKNALLGRQQLIARSQCQASYERRGKDQARANGERQNPRTEISTRDGAKGQLFSYLALAFLKKFQTSSSGVVRVRQKSKSNALSATLKGKGPVGGTASNCKQPQRKEGEIEPDDDDIDTNVFEGTNDFLEALYCQLICLAGPDPRLGVESTPLQFNEPPHSNSGATDSSISSVGMEFDTDPAPDAGHIFKAIANSTASSHMLQRLSASRYLSAGLHGSGQPPLFTRRRLRANLCRLNRRMYLLLSRSPGEEHGENPSRGVSCMTINHIPASNSLPSSLTNTVPCMAT
ncbi:hypothetical protein K438DRAFT_1943027 [Mycena galopus ATCC 62051]|nr:hypothetical protein K438DRAFT_1943027 [Mycena galopus ATCC 62051]